MTSIVNTEPAEVVDGPGDGVVNQRSAEVCLNWQNEQQSAFSSRKFPGVSHVDMVKNSNVLQVSLCFFLLHLLGSYM